MAVAAALPQNCALWCLFVVFKFKKGVYLWFSSSRSEQSHEPPVSWPTLLVLCWITMDVRLNVWCKINIYDAGYLGSTTHFRSGIIESHIFALS